MTKQQHKKRKYEPTPKPVSGNSWVRLSPAPPLENKKRPDPRNQGLERPQKLRDRQ